MMTVSSLANNDLQKDMMKLAVGKRITSAADDAASLAISEKIQSLVKGLDVGAANTQDMNNLVDTAEGGLSGVSDALSRIRELSVQASNGIYTAEDRRLMQLEVDGLKETIKDAASGTQFNTMKLLDGSFADKNLASNPDGSGMKIHLADTTLETLGIADFDLTAVDGNGNPNFDIGAIDKALDLVNSSRATMGAYSNRMEHTINYNTQASINQSAAKSRIDDLDFAEQLVKLSTNRALEQYSLFAQKQQMQNYSNNLSLMF